MVQRLHMAVFQRELPGPLDSTQQSALLDDLERQFELGRLVVIDGALPLLGIPPDFELVVRKRERVELPPLPPSARSELADKLTFFEVTFVDDWPGHWATLFPLHRRVMLLVNGIMLIDIRVGKAGTGG